MKWFGKNWYAPVCAEGTHVDTPIGERCLWCDEPIETNDRGFIRMAGQVVHLECDLRAVIGGINHQKGICTCCGGTEEPDPPNLSIRQAAKMAMDYWLGQNESRRT
jgi:hypothetical protein